MSEIKLVKINELVKGEKVDLFAKITSMDEKKTRGSSPKPYLLLGIKDEKGISTAKYGEKTMEDFPGFTVGNIVKIRGLVDEFNGFYVNVEQMRLIIEADNVNPEILENPTAEVAATQDNGGVTKKLNELVIGEVVDVVCFTKLLNQGNTKTSPPKPFMNLIVEDVTGVKDAKMWDTSQTVLDEMGIKAGKLVKVNVSVEERIVGNEKKIQLIVNSIRLITSDDGINESDYVRSAPMTGEAMYSEIMSVINEFSHPELKQLVTTLYAENRDALILCPGAHLIHHEVRAGLLYHKLTMLKAAQFMCSLYPFLNKDILCAGVVIHDIGKLKEIQSDEYGRSSDYTTSGKLLGHIIEGVKMVALTASKLGTPKELTDVLEHMVISHHNDELLGAYQKPMTPEAEMLSRLDMMDAKAYQFGEVVEKLEPNTFSEKVWSLGQRQLYKPAI